MWSWRRHQAFDDCPRRYALQYYGARGGGRAAAGSWHHWVWRLKRTSSVAQWSGLVVHRAAKRGLDAARGGRRVATARLVDGAAREARGRVRAAEDGVEPFLEDLEGRDHASGAGLVEEVVEQVRRLADHPVFQRLLRVPGRILEVDRLHRDAVAGVPAYIAPDVVVDDGAGGRVVVDWKSGRVQDTATVDGQLAAYALYERERAAPARVVGVHADTRAGTHRTVPFDDAVLDATAAAIQERVAAMRAVLPDPDHDDAPVEGFRRLEEGDPACARCRFRGPCGRDPDAPGANAGQNVSGLFG